jgi:hypothetical protein
VSFGRALPARVIGKTGNRHPATRVSASTATVPTHTTNGHVDRSLAARGPRAQAHPVTPVAQCLPMLPPRHGGPLWTLQKSGREVACVVRLLPVGIDVRIEWDGQERVGRIFQTEGEVLAWAEEERQEYLAKGWLSVAADAHHPKPQ